MKRDDTLDLDTAALRAALDRAGAKHLWLAAEIGVAPRTIARWLGGQSPRIARRNAEALALALGCPLESIAGGGLQATRAEQQRAARLLQERELLLLLSPSDNWELAERLIRATMEPNLPLADLGRLYNLLSIASWRQGNYDEGAAHAGTALEIADRCGDAGIASRARLNLATIADFQGRLAEARGLYDLCLADPASFDSPAGHAAALSNAAALLRQFAEYDASARLQLEALRLFTELDRPYNVAIALTSLALLLQELGLHELALDVLERCDGAARAAGYDRGRAQIFAYRAESLAAGGETIEALRLVDESLRRLQRYDVHDLTCLEIAARVARRAGELDRARREIGHALERSAPFPAIHASALEERSRIDDDDEAWRQSRALLRALGLTRRARWRRAEYGVRRRESAAVESLVSTAIRSASTSSSVPPP